MPFAAFCKKCKIGNRWERDTSRAYMIGVDFSDIKAEISKHFKKVHGLVPDPNPESLSFRDDFKQEYVELAQYGDASDGRDMSHLTFTFTTRQFNSTDYKISVITHHHYDECIRRIGNKKRIDYELFEYF